ncbi:MAG: hypothetical protein Q8P46_10525 [Hyphomicrobiales bacterium]|nr:hypothetical protein [Hyphomicrobiales bacterium]
MKLTLTLEVPEDEKCMYLRVIEALKEYCSMTKANNEPSEEDRWNQSSRYLIGCSHPDGGDNRFVSKDGVLVVEKITEQYHSDGACHNIERPLPVLASDA